MDEILQQLIIASNIVSIPESTGGHDRDIFISIYIFYHS